jgi:hypothetical protein
MEVHPHHVALSLIDPTGAIVSTIKRTCSRLETAPNESKIIAGVGFRVGSFSDVGTFMYIRCRCCTYKYFSRVGFRRAEVRVSQILGVSWSNPRSSCANNPDT